MTERRSKVQEVADAIEKFQEEHGRIPDRNELAEGLGMKPQTAGAYISKWKTAQEKAAQEAQAEEEESPAEEQKTITNAHRDDPGPSGERGVPEVRVSVRAGSGLFSAPKRVYWAGSKLFVEM